MQQPHCIVGGQLDKQTCLLNGGLWWDSLTIDRKKRSILVVNTAMLKLCSVVGGITFGLQISRLAAGGTFLSHFQSPW